MPRTLRPDCVELAWREHGEGPTVVFASQFFSRVDVFASLVENLARDHRVITYDVRGTGESTRRGPYDLQTDAEDLAAVIEDGGEQAVIITMADGCNRAVRVAAERPDLVIAVVSPAGNPVGRQGVAGTDGLASSDSVLAALLEMMRTDYRGALRTIFSTGNPDWDEERIRERVLDTLEYCPQEAALPRMRAWIADDATEQALTMRDRLWLLEHGTNMWFPIEIAKRSREILPEANVLEVEDGPISRPDITADIVRRVIAGDPVAGRARGAAR
jgi:pimeloyl-ACP methyl ester carboxylesterase